MDKVDKILEQWKREKPELEVSSMGLIGRMARVAYHLSTEMEKTFVQHGLNRAAFDVMATLRRSGDPYALSPGDLMEAMMVTSGTVTNRIDQLEKAGLVKRTPNPEDGRGFLVSLTEKGFSLIDDTVVDHVKTQDRLVSGLTSRDRKDLDRLLAKYLTVLEKDHSSE